jgi:hypothetical protein
MLKIFMFYHHIFMFQSCKIMSLPLCQEHVGLCNNHKFGASDESRRPYLLSNLKVLSASAWEDPPLSLMRYEVFICCSDGGYQYQNQKGKNGILIITSKFV